MWNVGQESESIISFDLRISRSPAISFPTLTVASVARVTVALFVVMLTTRVSPGTADCPGSVDHRRPNLESRSRPLDRDSLSRLQEQRTNICPGRGRPQFRPSRRRWLQSIALSPHRDHIAELVPDSFPSDAGGEPAEGKEKGIPADLRELPEEFTQHESSVGVVERSRSIGH